MRKKRIKKDGAIYHVVARANRGEFIMRNDDIKKLFIKVLEQAKQKFDFQIKHFCIMNNHIHLVIKPIRGTDLSRLMQWILSVFAARFNRYFGYKGHVWYDRFKSVVIETLIQFIKTMQYVSDNPVKAGICRKACDYEFSGISYIRQNKQKLIEPPDEIIKLLFSEFL